MTRLAEDFQERRGVNVKTNDSGYKECGRGKRENWRREDPRAARLQGWLQPPGRWQFLFISPAALSRSLRLSTFISTIASLPFLHPRTHHPGITITGFIHCRIEVYLNVFRAISLDLSLLFRVSIGFSSLKAAHAPPPRTLFTLMGTHQKGFRLFCRSLLSRSLLRLKCILIKAYYLIEIGWIK